MRVSDGRCCLTAAALILGSLASCGGGSHEGGRVIVLGFDGMDYGFTKELLAEGRLPNLAKLVEQGSFVSLETSVPPESPVAWSNFTSAL